MKTKFLLATLAIAALAGCSSDADVASHNLSKAADNFEVSRRIVFYNGVTGDYMLSIEGLCSKGNNDDARQVSITCKTGSGIYKKHFLGLSDNVTYFIEQIEPATVGTYRYTVVFKPSVIIPDIQIKL
ncbi:MAG: hypothetical protein HQ445_02625 [Polaromonas sp.]|nr:hypothetical protein [Polaromonas sp.]